MGEAAAAAATADPVKEGCVGAGTGATIGKLVGGMRQAMKSGIGSATVALEGSLSGVSVAALVAVNAVGDVRDPQTGALIAGARKTPQSMELAGTEALMKRGLRGGFRRENTTLAVVATNAKLSKVQATKLAQLAGLGMARTIYPVNTMSDGDVVFALSLGNGNVDVDALGVAAAEAVALSIVRAVKLSPTMGGVPGLATLLRK
jgi:L-aminopeptidase/D-esterase-like protein